MGASTKISTVEPSTPQSIGKKIRDGIWRHACAKLLKACSRRPCGQVTNGHYSNRRQMKDKCL